MSHWTLQLLATSALCVALFGFAFAAAPHACEWGLEAYFWAGIGVVVLLLALPFLIPVTQVRWQQLLLSLCLGSAGLLVWAAGLFASNMRIICRLI